VAPEAKAAVASFPRKALREDPDALEGVMVRFSAEVELSDPIIEQPDLLGKVPAPVYHTTLLASMKCCSQ
jgi:hypothetical protein